MLQKNTERITEQKSSADTPKPRRDVHSLRQDAERHKPQDKTKLDISVSEGNNADHINGNFMSKFMRRREASKEHESNIDHNVEERPFDDYSGNVEHHEKYKARSFTSRRDDIKDINMNNEQFLQFGLDREKDDLDKNLDKIEDDTYEMCKEVEKMKKSINEMQRNVLDTKLKLGITTGLEQPIYMEYTEPPKQERKSHTTIFQPIKTPYNYRPRHENVLTDERGIKNHVLRSL